MAGSRSGAGKIQDEFEVTSSDQKERKFSKINRLVPKWHRRWSEGASSGKSWENLGIKRIMITDIDKIYLMYKSHDFIKSLKTKPEECSMRWPLKNFWLFNW